ncbi:hypothetical protein BJ546DRAFT_323271 [Cryomyces antarcticus]
MAAPDSASLRDLTGGWTMNKTLSDDPDALLKMQGVGWWTRKAIGLATIVLHIKQYTDDAGAVHIDIDQTATGGIKGTREERTLDWAWREHEDHIFGKLKGRARWIKLGDVDDAFLKGGWAREIVDGEAIEGYVESIGNGWTADQIWGFEMIEGKRYYTRHVLAKKESEEHKVRLVYDWQE